MGKALLRELWRTGVHFVSAVVVEGREERFYSSLGFRPLSGHKPYVIDRRPYVAKKRARRPR